MHCSDRSLEYVDTLKKERPLFAKEDGKALVGGNDQLVGFDLCEIRIDGEVES